MLQNNEETNQYFHFVPQSIDQTFQSFSDALWFLLVRSDLFGRVGPPYNSETRQQKQFDLWERVQTAAGQHVKHLDRTQRV